MVKLTLKYFSAWKTKLGGDYGSWTFYFDFSRYRINFLCKSYLIHSQDGDYRLVGYLMSFEGENPKKFLAVQGVQEETPRIYEANFL